MWNYGANAVRFPGKKIMREMRAVCLRGFEKDGGIADARGFARIVGRIRNKYRSDPLGCWIELVALQLAAAFDLRAGQICAGRRFSRC